MAKNLDIILDPLSFTTNMTLKLVYTDRQSHRFLYRL